MVDRDGLDADCGRSVMQIGLLGILTLIFVISKLAGWITWSWWLVFMPSIAGIVLFFLIMGLFLALSIWSGK